MGVGLSYAISLLRKGNSTQLTKLYSWTQPLIWVALFTLMYYTILDTEGAPHSKEPSLESICDQGCSGDPYGIVSAVFYYHFGCFFRVTLCLLFALVLVAHMLSMAGMRVPTTLLRRQYNVLYVRELLGSQRRKDTPGKTLSQYEIKCLLSDKHQQDHASLTAKIVARQDDLVQMLQDDTESGQEPKQAAAARWAATILDEKHIGIAILTSF